MAHDELLARLDLSNVYLTPYEEFEKRNSALRAVVELHQVTADGNCAWCYMCNYDRTGLYMDAELYRYPCPTIQAIEKELQ
jgi:hypothetical protein